MTVTVLADHSLLLAIPAFAPALIVVGVVIWVAMRDRRDDGPGDGPSRTTGQDGAP